MIVCIPLPQSLFGITPPVALVCLQCYNRYTDCRNHGFPRMPFLWYCTENIKRLEILACLSNFFQFIQDSDEADTSGDRDKLG